MGSGAEDEVLMGWTEERVELLKKLWLDGLSAGQIAKRLRWTTRNAVIGKVNRLGLINARRAPSAPKGSRPRAAMKPAGRRPKPALAIAGNGAVFEKAPAALRVTADNRVIPLPPDAPLTISATAWDPLPGIKPVLLIDADKAHCRWPIEPGDGEHWCCGAQTKDGPYCAAHVRLSRPPPRAKEWIDKRLGIPIRKAEAA